MEITRDNNESYRYTIKFDIQVSRKDGQQLYMTDGKQTATVADFRKGDTDAAVTVEFTPVPAETDAGGKEETAEQAGRDAEEGEEGDNPQEQQDDSSSGWSSPPTDLRSPSPSSPGDLLMKDAPPSEIVWSQ